MYWWTCSSSTPPRGHCVTTGPEVLTREITLPAAQAGHRDRALPLEKADHRGHRVLRGNSDAHMHMVRHQVPFDDLALFLTCQRMEDFSQLPTRLTKEHFATSFRASHIMHTFLRRPRFIILGI